MERAVKVSYSHTLLTILRLLQFSLFLSVFVCLMYFRNCFLFFTSISVFLLLPVFISTYLIVSLCFTADLPYWAYLVMFACPLVHMTSVCIFLYFCLDRTGYIFRNVDFALHFLTNDYLIDHFLTNRTKRPESFFSPESQQKIVDISSYKSKTYLMGYL